jgi:hypothetical protein
MFKQKHQQASCPTLCIAAMVFLGFRGLFAVMFKNVFWEIEEQFVIGH